MLRMWLIGAMLFAAIAGPSGLAAAADFPSTGVPEVANGAAAPFVGRWAMTYPSLEDSGGSVLAACDDPVVIAEVGPARIAYTSQDDERSEFALSASEGRTILLPDGKPALVAVWGRPDQFYVYLPGLDGTTNWDDPFVYDRCR